jgi:hypothetical protein
LECSTRAEHFTPSTITRKCNTVYRTEGNQKGSDNALPFWLINVFELAR